MLFRGIGIAVIVLSLHCSSIARAQSVATQTDSAQAPVVVPVGPTDQTSTSVAVPAAPATTDSSLTQQKPFTLTISGGLSLGNYEAGLNWALLKSRSPAEYDLRAATGASAGAINALLSALVWCAADDKSTAEDNLFRNVWLPVGLERLLPFDLAEYGARDIIFSKRVSHGKAREEVLKYIAAHQFRKGCTVQLAFPLTGERSYYAERSIPGAGNRTLMAGSNYYVVPMTMVVQDAKPVFVPHKTYLKSFSNAVGLIEGALGIAIDTVIDVVEASSAFPIAFGPVRLEYNYINGNACKGGKDACSMYFSDGGVFDNVPIRVANNLILATDCEMAKCDDPASVLSGVSNIYFDPDIRRLTSESCEEPRSPTDAATSTLPESLRVTGRIYSQALGTARKQVLFDTLRVAQQSNTGLNLEVPTRFAPLAGDLLFAFGAWLDEGFREHDYLLGIYDGIVHEVNDAPGNDFSKQLEKTCQDRCSIATRGFVAEVFDFEKEWKAGQVSKALALSGAPLNSEVPGMSERARILRRVLFSRHVVDSAQRVAGGFCNDELNIDQLAQAMDEAGYPFSKAESELLHAATDDTSMWWGGLMSRAVRRLANVEESGIPKDLATRADAITYAYDPRRSPNFKLKVQSMLFTDRAEHQLTVGGAWKSETGKYQLGAGALGSFLAAEHKEGRAGAYLDISISLGLPAALFAHGQAAYGFASERAGVNTAIGVQALDVVRVGLGYHFWINPGGTAWHDEWAYTKVPALFFGLRGDSIWTIAMGE